MARLITFLQVWVAQRPEHDPEEGFSTAELLGNAALGIAALVAIWAAMQALGIGVVEWIRVQLGI